MAAAFRHNGQRETDFLLTLTFAEELAREHEACEWLMAALVHEPALNFWSESGDSSNFTTLMIPNMVGRVSLVNHRRLFCCLHLSGNGQAPASRARDGTLQHYDFDADGFVSVRPAGVCPGAMLEAVRNFPRPPPSALTSCLVSGMPPSEMQPVWWALIGGERGFGSHPMFGPLPGETNGELSAHFSWEQDGYPDNVRGCGPLIFLYQ